VTRDWRVATCGVGNAGIPARRQGGFPETAASPSKQNVIDPDSDSDPDPDLDETMKP